MKRYRLYIGDFEKMIYDSDIKKEVELMYVKTLQKMMEEQEYPLFIYDRELKRKIQ